jgi:glycosyltransferase involved in cell wall biosynthesis
MGPALSRKRACDHALDVDSGKQSMTTVLMISGSWPPQVCGVGDYSERLCRELERNAVSVIRFASAKFSNLISPEIVRKINSIECDLVHIQYPTIGYRRSLTPRVIAQSVRDKPVVSTFHEYSVFRWYRHSWFSPYARYCSARIFTTDDERALFQRRFPVRKGIDLTIEIASNIPVSPHVARQPGKVCYFGLIAPNKGLEEFLDLCAVAESSANGPAFEIIGAIPERGHAYADKILTRAGTYGVQLSLHLPNDAVADRLAKSTFAYLPFPDGASAKRGTLAAAIVNGLIVVTPHTRITPEWIQAATVDAKTPFNALGAIVRIQNDIRQWSDMTKRIAGAAQRFRWDEIARKHVELYRRLLNQVDGNEINDAHTLPDDRRESRLAS